jgi:adenylate cyclase
VASVFAIILVTSAAERRNRRFVQEALGRYTSAALVKELMEHPEHLSLEWGERRGMSVYFSDIAGFTSFSESMEPEALVALLNDYLTHMTDLVLEHGGVVDKYIGDAVMAFWGAPIPNDDHAAAAVRCAIAMRDRCAELRPGWKRALRRRRVRPRRPVVGRRRRRQHGLQAQVQLHRDGRHGEPRLAARGRQQAVRHRAHDLRGVPRPREGSGRHPGARSCSR